MGACQRLPLSLLLLSMLLVSCSIVDIRDESHYSVHSGRIAEPVSQVIPGTTTKQWLLENLGEPNASRFESNGMEYLSYQFDEHVNLKTRILFLFNYQSKKVVRRQMEIALEDGVVVKIGSSKHQEKDELEQGSLLEQTTLTNKQLNQASLDQLPLNQVQVDQGNKISDAAIAQ